MRCLVVEDDVVMGAVLEDVLRDLGHSVQIARSVTAAMACLRSAKYDVLLLDYILPDGNSLEVADYAAATCPNVRTILLTGTNVFPNGEAAIMAPAIDWVLRKPVPLGDLEAIIEYAATEASRTQTGTDGVA